jgi:hypothetical protein
MPARGTPVELVVGAVHRELFDACDVRVARRAAASASTMELTGGVQTDPATRRFRGLPGRPDSAFQPNRPADGNAIAVLRPARGPELAQRVFTLRHAGAACIQRSWVLLPPAPSGRRVPVLGGQGARPNEDRCGVRMDGSFWGIHVTRTVLFRPFSQRWGSTHSGRRRENEGAASSLLAHSIQRFH